MRGWGRVPPCDPTCVCSAHTCAACTAAAIEVATSAIYLLLILTQLLLSYGTIKRLIAKAMADFHLQPVESDEASMHL